MSRRRETLAGRLTKTLTLWVGSVWLLCLLAVVWYTDMEINYNFDSELVEVSHRMFDIALDHLDQAPPQAPGKQTPLIIPGPGSFADAEIYYRLVMPDTRVLARSAESRDDMFDVALSNGFANHGKWRVYTLLHPTRGIYLQVADPLEERSETVNRTLFGLIVPFALLMPLLALLLRHIARKELRVLDDLSDEIAKRNGRQLDAIHLSAPPQELATVQEHVNRLLERLSQALDVERALAANAAHELRTPLTTARLRLQTALEHGLARTDVEAAIASLQTLSHRTEKLLQLSRAESSAPFTRDSIDLTQLASTVSREFWLDEEASARLELITPPASELDGKPLTAKGDFDALAIALRNLIENALHYSGTANVEIIVGPGAEIAVRDDGPGVPAEQLEKLQRRHVRQSSQRAGYGLGLSIVSSIAQKHDAQFVLSSPPPGQPHGFEARLILQPAD
ncbi:ATP-binding protein [Diaphorobacter aerolatus]|uniref:histidine kinase n=1 Tax=Diaphorobacter aerolatus TaxID=1288495 RepID=A0A7H0GKN3_9BURK|nr:ATP-binding protein [Diaphorobacter aerolatus]QNP48849.1 sensor histidine kinase [Diaphorobacter aerolatus]